MADQRITTHMRACAIATRIRDDICDRSGLQNEWENIDEETQQDIIDTWVEIATQEIARGSCVVPGCPGNHESKHMVCEALSNEEKSPYYEITPSSDGCCTCGAGQYWTICYQNPDGSYTEIGTSWQGTEGKETAEDICDLMNMAYDAGQESVQKNAAIAAHQKWLTERAEWLKKERLNGGNWEYLKNKEEETRYCLEKFEAQTALKDIK